MVKRENRDEAKQKLRPLIQAAELMNYTIQITSNKKVFDPKYQWLIDKLLEDTSLIYYNLFDANETYLFHHPNERKELQDKALHHCKTMAANIFIAHKIFKLHNRRVSHWTKLVTDLKTSISYWKQSDSKRNK